MFETVKRLLAKQLRMSEEQITLTARIMEDLGADSVAILELLMTLEEDYGIVIPDGKLAEFVTVEDIVVYLDRQIANKG